MKSMDTQSLPPTEPLIGHMNYFPKLGLNQSLSYGFKFENHPMVGKSRKPRQTKWYWNRDLPKSKQGRELSRKKEETTCKNSIAFISCTKEQTKTPIKAESNQKGKRVYENQYPCSKNSY